MREKTLECKLVRAVKKVGGIAPKFVSPGTDGMPDRIVLLPGGHLAFVEVKAPGEKPRPLQLARHKLLRGLGFKVYVLDEEQQIGGLLDEIRTPSLPGICHELHREEFCKCNTSFDGSWQNCDYSDSTE